MMKDSKMLMRENAIQYKADNKNPHHHVLLTLHGRVSGCLTCKLELEVSHHNHGNNRDPRWVRDSGQVSRKAQRIWGFAKGATNNQ